MEKDFILIIISIASFLYSIKRILDMLTYFRLKLFTYPAAAAIIESNNTFHGLINHKHRSFLNNQWFILFGFNKEKKIFHYSILLEKDPSEPSTEASVFSSDGDLNMEDFNSLFKLLNRLYVPGLVKSRKLISEEKQSFIDEYKKIRIGTGINQQLLDLTMKDCGGNMIFLYEIEFDEQFFKHILKKRKRDHIFKNIIKNLKLKDLRDNIKLLLSGI